MDRAKIYSRFFPGRFYRHKKILKTVIQNIESFKGDFDLDKIYQIIEKGLREININFSVKIINSQRDVFIYRYFSNQEKSDIRAPGLGSIKLPLGAVDCFREAVLSRRSVFSKDAAKVIRKTFPQLAAKLFSGNGSGDIGAIASPLIIKEEAIGVIAYFSKDLGDGLLSAYDEFSQNLARALANTILYEENRRSEEKYRMLVDNANDGVAIIDPSGRISFANNALCEISGYSREELYGMNIGELIHPADKKKVLSNFENRIKGLGSDSAHEFRIINKQGDLVFLSYNGASISRGGRIVGLQSVVRDITENKKLENNIKKAKNRYEQIIDTINDGLCVINKNYEITSCNRAFAEKVGLPIREVLGKKCRAIIPRYEGYLLAKHCAHTVCDKTCGAGEAFQDGQAKLFVEENRDKKGQNHYHSISIFPTKDPGGAIYQVVMTIRNITADREAEDRIRRLREFNQRIFDTAPISIVALDRSGTVLAANTLAKSLMEKPGQELIGRNLLKTKQISQNQALKSYFRELLSTGKSFIYDDLEYSEQDSPDSRRSLNIIAVPLYDKDGAVEGAVSMALDNTEAKNAKDKLEELNKNLEKNVLIRTRELDDINKRLSQAISLKSKFIADASHELRTPLTVIKGNIDLNIREAFQSGLEPPEAISMILDEVERMTVILSDLTILTNADSRTEKPLHEEVNLGHLVMSIGQSLKVLADQKKIALIFKKEAKSVKILGDETKLEKLLLNIVRNAIKYSETKGQVRIRVERSPEKAQIIVEDKGIGIPAEDLPYIFERFYRVDKSRSRDEGGTGLGLSICKWIAELHGGNIEVASELGKGSVFTVNLPYDYKKAPLPPSEP